MRVYFLKAENENPLYHTMTRFKQEVIAKAGSKAMKAKGAIPYVGRLNTGKRRLENYDILGYAKKINGVIDVSSFIEEASPLIFRDAHEYIAVSMMIGKPLRA